MHTDEAVHALKFGSLLEQNTYRYDPAEYHGPALNYLTLIPAWIVSAKTLSEIDESTLRIIPVIMGTLLIAALLLLHDGLNRPALLFAGFFTAVSPAMVFYSRYYIQEMLLVFFTFGVIGSGFRYYRTRRMGWALSTGMFLGLMHATKETAILVLAAMGLALVLLKILYSGSDSPSRPKKRIQPVHILICLSAALFISALFYSSFLQNPKGILDSFLTYKNYFQKAGHQQWHVHPWFYYLRLLFGSKHTGMPLWSEAFILLLSGAGVAAAVKKPLPGTGDAGLLRFILFYTILLTVLYSLIPYKTPWTMLGFYHGWILLAGIGAASIIKAMPRKGLRTGIIALLIIGTSHLVMQSCLSNYLYFSNPSNPYVYGHTGSDVFTITSRIDTISRSHPDGKNMFIEVICPGDDYWPLPWYLRSFPNVGWFHEVDFDRQPAPVVLASPDVESDLIKKLYEYPAPGEKSLYLPLFQSYMELRPHVEIRGYIMKDLWDAVQLNDAAGKEE
jgi:uncharacterized protein (TIGR03663 family)